jgi:hypothetical protein
MTNYFGILSDRLEVDASAGTGEYRAIGDNFRGTSDILHKTCIAQFIFNYC